MKFTTTALLTMAVVSYTSSAAPAPLTSDSGALRPLLLADRDGQPSVLSRRAGPSGTLTSPAGQDPDVGGYTPYKVGDQIDVVYTKARTAEATTTAINATLITFDGKVTFNANKIEFASFLSSPDDEDTITASFKIPPLYPAPGYPEQSSWVANLQVYEYQEGSLGAAPFLAAAPRLEINA